MKLTTKNEGKGFGELLQMRQKLTDIWYVFIYQYRWAQCFNNGKKA